MVFADGRLLTERAVIRYTPAWHVAAQLCQATRRDWRMNASALLVAPAHFQGRHAALPASLKEVQDLQMLWPNHQALLETHATAAAIQALNMQGGLAQFDVVHFATHVQFDPLWSRLSGLALHDCDLWLQDVLDWRLDAQIVCVSGCEAARGAAVGGEEFLGFEAAMIAAGARNVLSPQWHVADTFAHAFIIDVMQRCRQHGDLALALAEAQRASIFTPPPLQWAGWRVFGMG
jgi:CHAT domain-containing protein